MSNSSAKNTALRLLRDVHLGPDDVEAKHDVSEAKHDVVPRPHDVVEATDDVHGCAELASRMSRHEALIDYS